MDYDEDIAPTCRGCAEWAKAYKKLKEQIYEHPRADEPYARFLEWRNVNTPCPGCSGAGSKAYGSTATWRGGLGGQAITMDVCDRCWGSGDKDCPWTSIRKLEAALKKCPGCHVELQTLSETKRIIHAQLCDGDAALFDRLETALAAEIKRREAAERNVTELKSLVERNRDAARQWRRQERLARDGIAREPGSNGK